jgi:hypothetical protein
MFHESSHLTRKGEHMKTMKWGWVPLSLTLALGCGSEGSTAAGMDGSAAEGGSGGADGAWDVSAEGTGSSSGGNADSGGDGSSGGGPTDGSADAPPPADANSASCPGAMPAPSSHCTAAMAGYCYYGNTICSCDPGGGFQSDAGVAYNWDCGSPPGGGCPATVPADKSPCSSPGLMCTYDFRPCAAANPSFFVCQGGTWKYMATPCQ